MVSLSSVRRQLAQGRREGLRRVVLSGGEATLHPEYLKIIRLARQLGYKHIQTITNGRRFCYPAFLEDAVAAGLDEITFSLHGHTPALHDRLTRTPGAFLQAVAGLRAAVAMSGLIISVDVVINRLNLPVLRELLEFYIGLGVREFDLLALVPFGDAWRRRRELFCDFSRPQELSQLHHALELGRRPDIHLWTNRLRPEYLEGFESFIQPPEKILDEVRGRRQMLARWIGGGKTPSCAGEACPQCFLRDFCQDLARLLKAGCLPPRHGPLCSGSAGAGEPFRFRKKQDIVDFAEFYILSRYFAKGSRCGRCSLGLRCDGMNVRDIRQKGFSSMTPVEQVHG